MKSVYLSLNPEVKDRRANLQPAAWRITALFQLDYISFHLATNRPSSPTAMERNSSQVQRIVRPIPIPHILASAIEPSAHHNTLDYTLESKAEAPPQADFPREVEKDVYVLSLLQEAYEGASEFVHRERRPRMTDITPSNRTRTVMADHKGA